MNNDFVNKNEWALILGGSSGLGLASAKKLALHGMNIIIVHRNRKSEMNQIEADFIKIKETGVGFLSLNIDLLKPEKRMEAIAKIANIIDEGRIKTIVHSVAKGNLKPMIDATHVLKNDDFHLTIDAMAISLYDWVTLVFKAALFAEDARVISFTSEGNTKAWKNYAAVSAAKVALEAITRSIALEFAPYGIKANCLQPGAVDTQSLRMIPGHEQIIEHSLKRNPFNRITTPEDVANVVYLLCREEASWINGCVIPVNGGEHLN
ncbi:enoyl-[acyl-carrier protein] reductase I [Aquimarina sp. EL_43]|uniref:SDR family oxidoreductase n=1 Tax=unclassified Aquimarina TaxID=2627091 RepID=UPI0018CBD1A3|nr:MULTISPECIES: SDR family oxidoreductase [unclassified Aquimarina]MBG6129544.1 enoyl-[acyl-carrier protein] reductase I [Aquimarina sp. EL_35]MBG6150609.1 enoyl-[acyl-carrier protein] reductase I [Aquimarina sp. EL_32]MBG6168083.1 enoyl-[acyl-carrier protein] reductase I [Aquimarina sp. EL_43]